MDRENIWNIHHTSKDTLIRSGRLLNTSLDKVFYNVDSLTTTERDGLLAYTNPEGSILIVSPVKDNQEIIKQTPFEFIDSQGKSGDEPVDVVVVAGVGSSALGTAALARSVADCMGCRVAGIISGYGLADLVSEAMGGWFVLGYKNRIRDAWAKWFEALEMKDHVWDDTSYASLIKEKKFTDFPMKRYIYGSPDATSLILLLFHLRDKVKVLIGHSKGNYVIENALQGIVSLCQVKRQKIPRDLQIITLGAVIRFPEHFGNVTQCIGQLDFFGMMNSRSHLNSHILQGAWHSLNTQYPGNMEIAKALKIAGAI